MMDNDTILNTRMNTYNQITGPRVGDWIRESNGRMTRGTHDWGNGSIMQHGGGEFGRFYLGDGYLSYSGGLDIGIKKADLIRTNEVKPGKVWFFKRDYPMAGNGIDYMVDFRVYEVA